MPRPFQEIRAGNKQLIVKSTNDSVDLLSDTVDLASGGRAVITKALYVGVTGHIRFLPPGQSTPVTYYNVPVGKHVVAAQRIYLTATSADEIVADYDFENE